MFMSFDMDLNTGEDGTNFEISIQERLKDKFPNDYRQFYGNNIPRGIRQFIKTGNCKRIQTVVQASNYNDIKTRSSCRGFDFVRVIQCTPHEDDLSHFGLCEIGNSWDEVLHKLEPITNIENGYYYFIIPCEAKLRDRGSNFDGTKTLQMDR